MLRSLLPLLIIGLCIGLAAWLVFIWALRSGQFDDVEGPKYRMLDDEDETGRDNATHEKEEKKDADESGRG